jgi:hypothetical protein
MPSRDLQMMDNIWSPVTLGTFVSPDALCPDLLRYEQIGAADNWRGRVVRAFFFVMKLWRVK